jgi:hypothetical protein
MDCLSCRIRLNVSSSMWFECCLRMQIMLQIIWHAALISSHHAIKDSMAECYQRASERACVTFPLFVFGQGTTFFFLMVICNSLNLLLKSLPINIIKCIKFHNHLTLRKWCYTPLQDDFALDPMIPPFVFHFSNICHVTTRKPRLPQCIMVMNE